MVDTETDRCNLVTETSGGIRSLELDSKYLSSLSSPSNSP